MGENAPHTYVNEIWEG